MPFKFEQDQILPPEGGLNKRQRCAEGLSVKTMLHDAELRVIVALECTVLDFAGILVVFVEVPSIVSERVFMIRETV